MDSKHSLPTVRQDVHAQVQYESAHRQSTQQTQALAMSVLRKELCHHERPEAALVEVRLKQKIKKTLARTIIFQSRDGKDPQV